MIRVWCIEDPIPPGIRVLSHADLESEHYRAIRTNPQYRIEQHIRDLEDQLAPPRFPWWEREVTQDAPETPRKPLEMPERISYQLDQLKAQLLWLQKSVNTHVDKSKKRVSGF